MFTVFPLNHCLQCFKIIVGDVSRNVTTIKATDNDEGENAEIKYSIYHVSNNGNRKFKIDESTGQITTVGKLNAGDQYSLTVQATDSGIE